MPEPINQLVDHTENPRVLTPDKESAVSLEAESDGTEEVPATDEEQDTYDMIVARALSFMHGEGQKNILKMLGSGETPAKSLGQATANIAQMMYKSATEGGREVTSETLINAAAEIMEELNDMGQAAGVFKYENEQESEEQLDDGMGWAMKYYGDMDLQSGAITPEWQEEAQGQVKEGVAKEQIKMKAVDEGVKKAINTPQEKRGMVKSAMGAGV